MKKYSIIAASLLMLSVQSVVACEHPTPRVLVISEASSGLALDTREAIRPWGRLLVRHPEWSLSIGVITDREGTENYDLHRAERWGKQTQTVLETEGVRSDQISIQSMGESYGIVDNQHRTYALHFTLLDERGEPVGSMCFDGYG